MANPKRDPKKDSPIEESGVKKFPLLEKEREKLSKHLKDRTMIDSEARRGSAVDHYYLPPFMTKMAVDLMISCLTTRLLVALLTT